MDVNGEMLQLLLCLVFLLSPLMSTLGVLSHWQKEDSVMLEFSCKMHLGHLNILCIYIYIVKIWGGVNGHGREKGSYGNGGEHDDRNRR